MEYKLTYANRIGAVGQLIGDGDSHSSGMLSLDGCLKLNNIAQ